MISLLSFSPVGYLLPGSFAYNAAMLTNYWLFVGITLLLTVAVGYNTYASARLLRTWRPDRNLLLLPAETGIRLLLLALCIGLGLLSGVAWPTLGWVWPGTLAPVIGGILWGGALALFFMLTTAWIRQRTGGHFYSTVIIQAIVPRTTAELVGVSLAMLSVVALEELLFRSLLLGGLMAIVPLPILVVGWSIVFGLLHSPQGLWGVAGATLAGLLLSWLFLRYGTLLAPLIAHYVTNEVQIIQAMRMRTQL
jgi:membrane protease YdiL (CAAX protease family)